MASRVSDKKIRFLDITIDIISSVCLLGLYSQKKKYTGRIQIHVVISLKIHIKRF